MSYFNEVFCLFIHLTTGSECCNMSFMDLLMIVYSSYVVILHACGLSVYKMNNEQSADINSITIMLR